MKSQILEIENQGLLFPLYNTKYIVDSNEVKAYYKLIQLIQEEIGLFCKYQIETDYFDKEFGHFHPNLLGHNLMAEYIDNFFKKENHA